MTRATFREIAGNGLWHNNPALVQLVGLCPLLAVTTSVVNALGLGLATLLVMMGSNIVVSLVRHQTAETIRVPTIILVIAAFTTTAELLMKAYTYELYQILGIFIPLIVTNCTILSRAISFASKNSVAASAFDGLMTGLGFAFVLVLLGGLRELIGHGTLFTDMHLLFGDGADWKLQLFAPGYHFLIAVLPPGAFMLTGLLIALKNAIDVKSERRRCDPDEKPDVAARRVRTTGDIS